MMTARAPLASLVLALAAGCSPDPVEETHQGALESSDTQHPNDQSFYDEYRFKAQEGWQITIRMNSTDVDSYLQLRRDEVPEEQYLVEDDDSGGERNALISGVAPANDTYVVWANTNGPGETGSYSLQITAKPVAQ